MEFSEVIEVLDRGSSVDVQSNHTFESLMIGQKTLERLKANQFDRPSPVQAKAIPVGLLGRDMLVQAKSGTGKTLVFSVLAVENLDLKAAYIQKVIITPTREISTQIKETVRRVAPSGARTSVYVGGCGHKLNIIDLKKTRPQIVIGTPGRVAQLIKLGSMDISHVDFFVLDEADKLMDDVFKDDINLIINSLPSIRQVAVFSATYPRNLDSLLSTFLRDAALVRFNSDDVQLIGIKQYVVPKCSPMLHALTHVLKSTRFVQALVFCDQIAKCEPIATHLKSEGLDVTFVSSAMSQKERQFAVDQLRTKRVKILVSSDLTARGIDADNVNLVINVDAAANEETYFHRIGRAARFGAHGAAVTLLEDEKALKCFTALAYRGKVSVKRVGHVDLLPNDLVKNLEFWTELPYFIDPEKDKMAKKSGPRDIEKVPDRKSAEKSLKMERGEEAPDLSYKYDRNEMLTMKEAASATSSVKIPEEKGENVSKIAADPEKIATKLEELSIENNENEPEIAQEKEVIVVKKSFKERLAELRAAKSAAKMAPEEQPKVEAKSAFKFVPTREKAKKKYYMRGELQHIRDAVTDEQWRAYAETKFDFTQEPFLDAFGSRARRGSTPTSSKDDVEITTEKLENFGGGDVPCCSNSVVQKPLKSGKKPAKKQLDIQIQQYSRYQMKQIQKEVPKEQWLPYIKVKWDTSEEPWELDPSMRCPFEERLRRIRKKEKDERRKVIEERKKKRDDDRSELVSIGRTTQHVEIKETSWEAYQKRCIKDFDEKVAKWKQDEVEGKETSTRKIGPVVPVREPPLIYRYRVDMYKQRLADQDAWLMQETKIEEGTIQETEVQTDDVAEDVAVVVADTREYVEMEVQTDDVAEVEDEEKNEEEDKNVENQESGDSKDEEYSDEEDGDDVAEDTQEDDVENGEDDDVAEAEDSDTSYHEGPLTEEQQEELINYYASCMIDRRHEWDQQPDYDYEEEDHWDQVGQYWDDQADVEEDGEFNYYDDEDAVVDELDQPADPDPLEDESRAHEAYCERYYQYYARYGNGHLYNDMTAEYIEMMMQFQTLTPALLPRRPGFPPAQPTNRHH